MERLDKLGKVFQGLPGVFYFSLSRKRLRYTLLCAELDGDVMLMRHNKAIAAVHGYSCYIAHAQAASQTVKPVSAKCLPIMIMMVMIIIIIIIIIIVIIIIIMNPFDFANNEGSSE